MNIKIKPKIHHFEGTRWCNNLEGSVLAVPFKYNVEKVECIVFEGKKYRVVCMDVVRFSNMDSFLKVEEIDNPPQAARKKNNAYKQGTRISGGTKNSN